MSELEVVYAIPLRTHGGGVRAWTVVDAVDREVALAHRWHESRGYVVRRPGGETRMLHREVLGMAPGDGWEVDHFDGNPLNNRRSNLRVVTRAGNGQNVRAHRDSTSRLRGVSWDESRGKWKAQARAHGRNVFLGRFDTEERAAEVAARFRAEHMPFSADADVPLWAHVRPAGATEGVEEGPEQGGRSGDALGL